MVNKELLPDFPLANEGDLERPFSEYLGNFNILAIRRVPVPSHGPATKLLRRFLAQNRVAEGGTVRGFDIRSPDQPCKTCRGPRIVSTGRDLATVCDGDGSILQKFGVVGYDRFFVVRSGSHVIDMGSISEIGLSGMQRELGEAWAQHRTDAAGTERSRPFPTVFDGRPQSCRVSKRMA